jgi:hypothetical protein
MIKIIRIIETVWDDSPHNSGAGFCLETDKAFQAIPEDSTRFYIQGDEGFMRNISEYFLGEI